MNIWLDNHKAGQGNRDEWAKGVKMGEHNIHISICEKEPWNTFPTMSQPTGTMCIKALKWLYARMRLKANGGEGLMDGD